MRKLRKPYRFVSRAIVLFLLATVVISGSNGADLQETLERPVPVYRHIFRPRGEPFAGISSHVMGVADLDSDGYDELIIYRKLDDEKGARHVVEIRDHTGEHLLGSRSLPTDFLPSGFSALDIDDDGFLEVTTSFVVSDSMFLEVLDRHAQLLVTIPVIGREDTPSQDGEGFPEWIPGLRPQATIDCNGDGMPEILCTGGCGYWRLPRGVWALDWVNRRVLWHYATGAKTTDLVVVPDSTGKPCIVVSTYSVCNGAQCNGTDDSCSYIIVLSRNGELIRLHPLSERGYTGTKIALLAHGADASRLVSLTACGDLKDPKPAILRSWHGAADSVISQASAGVTDTDLLTGDVDGDGQDELMLATQLGGLAIYRADLSLASRIPVGRGKLIAAALGDMDADGLPEVVVGKGKGCALVDPRNGAIRAFRAGLLPLTLVHHGENARPTLVGRGVSGWLQLELSKNPLWRASGSFVVGWPMLAGAGGLMLVLGLLAAMALTQASRQSVLPASGSTGMAVVDHRARIIRWNRSFVRLLCSDDQSPEDSSLHRILTATQAEQPLTVQYLRERAGQWVSTVVEKEKKREPVLIKMTKLGGASRSRWLLETRSDEGRSGERSRLEWASLAPRVAHDLKSPLSTLSLATERSIHAARSDSHWSEKSQALLETIIRQVLRIELLGRNFLKLADLEKPVLTMVDPRNLLARSLCVLRDRVPPDISIEERIESPLPLLWADAEQLLVAMENLYENSIAAQNGGGSILVSAYRVRAMPGVEEARQEAVVIEVGDTGEGISATDLPHIFETGFTRKARGSGLGLAIVKRVIEQHQGHMEVHSELCIGTTFALYLPAARSERSDA